MICGSSYLYAYDAFGKPSTGHYHVEDTGSRNICLFRSIITSASVHVLIWTSHWPVHSSTLNPTKLIQHFHSVLIEHDNLLLVELTTYGVFCNLMDDCSHISLEGQDVFWKSWLTGLNVFNLPNCKTQQWKCRSSPASITSVFVLYIKILYFFFHYLISNFG